MFLVPADLTAFADIDSAKAEAMIEDAEAMAALTAPCITDAAFQADAVLSAAARAVLRQAILRWHEAGAGATQTQVAGVFSQTTQYQARRGMFWPSEIEQLQELCKSFRGADSSRAFSMTPSGATGAMHAPWCNFYFGATYCSCGADLTGFAPLYEQP